ncbi:unnamed protein product [Pocillopora meandrina]|uniref:Uncharacterized protein n=1 Tax=Pocillopora meandrina TaxID=46732 RepID=A0AAU9XD44_9CNID|nr:unnamed protein product [Pocillopora meandrina]
MFGIARRVQLRHKRGASKMDRLLFTLTVLVMMTAPGCAVKCYVCSGNEDTCSKSKLESNRAIYLKECPSIADRCARELV